MDSIYIIIYNYRNNIDIIIYIYVFNWLVMITGLYIIIVTSQALGFLMPGD